MRLLASVLVLGLLALAGCGAAPTKRVHSQFETYVALGDSYTAAPRAGTVKGPALCNQTTGNYPSLVAASVGAPKFVDRSCTGAQTKDLTESQHPGVPPQLDALSSSTDLVTVGIGANDHNILGTVILVCPALATKDRAGAPCRSQFGSPDKVKAVVDEAGRNVASMLREIRKRAPHAQILLVGYPQIVPDQGTCAQLPLGAGDYPFARDLLRELDSALRAAAEQESVTYVDVWQASAGHDICSADPWVNGSSNAVGLPVAYHPFEEEQRAVAALIEKALPPGNG